MNTLTLLNKPHELTQSSTYFNGAFYDHANWEIDRNILTFQGYKIATHRVWFDTTLRLPAVLDEIEDRFIKKYTEKYGFLSLKTRIFLGVRGEFVYKKRLYRKFTTNIWTVIDNKGDSYERSTNQE